MFLFLRKLLGLNNVSKESNYQIPKGKYVEIESIEDFSGKEDECVFEHAYYDVILTYMGILGQTTINWKDGKVVSGDYYCTHWNGGEFCGGVLDCSEFNNGKFNGKRLACEEFNGGECNSGVAEVDVWNNGVFRGKTLSVGEWHDGVFEGDVFHGKWYDGVWKGKKFRGIDLSGQGLEN